MGPVPAHIIMTEWKKIIAKVLFDKSLIKVYMRYIDDTLPLVNKKDINLIHGRLSSFDEKIKFTIDNFTDGNAYFLDI